MLVLVWSVTDNSTLTAGPTCCTTSLLLHPSSVLLSSDKEVKSSAITFRVMVKILSLHILHMFIMVF